LSEGVSRVYTIPPGAPFLRTLVEACVGEKLGIAFPKDVNDFSNVTIYVPTRRAARALSHAFADRVKPDAVLLPRIVPLGDPSDLEERSILTADSLALAGDVPPAINDLERRLRLTALIERWHKARDFRVLAERDDGFSLGGGFPDSFALAGDLADLIDEFAIEGIHWSKVKALAPERFDQYWSITREFLQIAGEAWPVFLEAQGWLDPAERLNRLLRAEADRLKRERPTNPVIAAGSTGTVPATAGLLAAIARLPNGVVVLPGLDKTLDQRGWRLVADQVKPGDAQPGHPQAALKRLLPRLGVERETVIELGDVDESKRARTAVLQAAARPAEATDDWPVMRHELQSSLADAMKDVSVVEAPDERLEAVAIAVALRETLERDNKTAALVTPDRALAGRVAMELRRWGISADDSAGTPLSMTPLGGFSRLVARAITDDFSPTATMAVVTHACFSAASEQATAALEIAALRGNDLAPGLDGLARSMDQVDQRRAANHAPRALKKLSDDAIEAARNALKQVVDIFRPLASLASTPQSLSDLAAAHLAVIEALAGERSGTGSDAVAMARVFDQLVSTEANPVLAFTDFAAMLDLLLAADLVPPAEPTQGRIKIWGLLEARLLEADLVVLGGLNEGVWPGDARTDAFLNRAMREELGLPPPERRIGQSAHDFAQAFGAPQVVITHALAVESTPMVASRFLRRLDAFVGKDEAKALRSRGQWLLDAAAWLDKTEPVAAAKRPNPKPDAAKQPKSLSVTEIATLMRDPYAIYAKHVLELEPVEPLETGFDARDRGIIIHEALATFITESREAWPEDPLASLLAAGRKSFAPYAAIESVSAFWWPVFEKVAEWFVAWEDARRASVRHSHVEISGSLMLDLADGTPFELRSKADRIDLMANGTLGILDYKTGEPPTAKTIAAFHEPQLTLMAAMARKGGFRDVSPASVQALSFVRVGSRAEETKISFDNQDIDAVAEQHIGMLKTFLNSLRDPQNPTGFLSRRAPRRVKSGGAYDHLARAREWMAADDD
jgi:ATP-dependent helicase/nuclease subunit B